MPFEQELRGCSVSFQCVVAIGRKGFGRIVMPAPAALVGLEKRRHGSEAVERIERRPVPDGSSRQRRRREYRDGRGRRVRVGSQRGTTDVTNLEDWLNHSEKFDIDDFVSILICKNYQVARLVRSRPGWLRIRPTTKSKHFSQR
jgi:hypothetical protein